MFSAHRRLVVTLLTALAMGLSTLLLAPAAHAADTGVIAGVVKAKPLGATAAPLEDAYVGLYRYTQETGTSWYADVQSDAQGRFTFAALPDGTYNLWVSTFNAPGNLADEWYDNGWYGSTDIVVANGAAVTLDDVVLEPTGWIAGRVTDTSGAPFPHAAVSIAMDDRHGGRYVFADAQGYYDTRTSPGYDTDDDGVGDLIEPPIARDFYVSSHGTDSYAVDGVVYADSGQTTTVSAGAGATVNLVLTRLKTVVFTVTDAQGSPLTRAPVDLRFQFTEGGPWELPQYGPIETDFEGKFMVVEGRAYATKLRFHPASGDTTAAVAEWFDGSQGTATEGDAVPITWSDPSIRRDYAVQVLPLTGPQPGVSGTVRSGSTLTATPGTWSVNKPALAYQWLADGAPITGATASTLALIDAQVGKKVTVKTTATVDGKSVTMTSAQTAPVEALLVPATPTISGTARVGNTLTANTDDWAPDTATLTYQWLADGEPLTGATTSTLPLTDTHLGAQISVEVTGTLGTQTATRTSTQTAAVEALLAPATPTIEGTPRVGNTLTATTGTWTADTTFSYQWLANGEPIEGATETELHLTDAHTGQQISVTVTGTLGDQTADRTSAETDPVEALLAPATPTIDGSPRVGNTLTATTGTWTTGTTFSYQWLANGEPIEGATETELDLTDAHSGQQISVVVTGTLGDQSADRTSAVTAAVVGTLTSSKPKIRGKAKVGKKLKVKSGVWGPGTVGLTYQWLRNGKVIKKATKAKYKLRKKDQGKRIQVRVTGTRPSYDTLQVLSAKTKKVKR